MIGDRHKIWLLIGDEYNPHGFSPDTPCKVGKDLMYLRDVVSSGNIKGDFEIHLGHGVWDNVCISGKQYARGSIEVSCDSTQMDNEKIVSILYGALNSSEVKSELEKIGMAKPHIRVWLE